jgi:uncharacterized membrane protein YedE/YeeE
MDDPVFLRDDKPEQPMTNRQTYNMVTDTVTGPNVRLKDNLLQGLVIFVCLVLGAVIGAIVVADHVPGALVGGFIGVLVGLFGSGIFLMIFRAARHARGKHD